LAIPLILPVIAALAVGEGRLTILRNRAAGPWQHLARVGALGGFNSMTNSTRWIGLIMTALLWAGTAAAQSSTEWDESSPVDLPLPSMEAEPSPAPEPTGESVQSTPAGAEHGQPFDGYHAEEYSDFAPGLHDQWHGPTAPIESTGTWLRRGFWYAEAEAVVWNRMWNRDDKFLAVADPQVDSNRNFFDFVANIAANTAFNTNNMLMLQSSNPGQDASVRATLGQFLFRDSKNRDHTAEFTAFGGGDWDQVRVITSPQPFGLFVPFHIDGSEIVNNQVVGNPSFDRSSQQRVTYSSTYNSFEGNYRVRSRLSRDRLIMDANGHWHRSGSNTWVREYLVGLRFMEMRDILDWRAEDIREGTSTATGNDGAYLIRTDNDLFGFQMGTGLTYEAPRWSLGINCKGGVFVNDALGRSTMDFTINDEDDFDLRLAEDELSFIGEAKLLGRFHLTPSFSVRASYELMYLESVALAPSQANFIPVFNYLNTTGDPLYHGASFGFEAFW
jgi:hypothetical protein